MLLGLALLLATALSPQAAATQAPASQTQPDWLQKLQLRHDSLIRRNGPGTDPVLRDQLLAMMKTDQDARAYMLKPSFDPKTDGPKAAAQQAETDRSLTEQLQQIVAEKGWPTIALVGIEASNAAMLILTHTRDHDWQRSLLPQLENLADTGKIDGSALALVIDKELVASGQLQRYGSQFKFVDGEMAMFAVEDPENLDRRRADVLLPPMDVYRQLLMDMYHLKISNKFVAPKPPQPPSP